MIVISGPTLSFDLSFFGNSFDLSQDACFYFCFFYTPRIQNQWSYFRNTCLYRNIGLGSTERLFDFLCAFSYTFFIISTKFIILYRNIILVPFVLPVS